MNPNTSGQYATGQHTCWIDSPTPQEELVDNLALYVRCQPLTDLLSWMRCTE